MKERIRAQRVAWWLGVGALFLLMGALSVSFTNVAASVPREAPASARPDLSGHWVVTSSPNVGTGSNYLASVTGNASNDVTAVGSYTDASFHSHTLVEHWNGTSWSVESSPDPNANINRLASISVDRSGGYWAAGTSLDSTYGALIMRQTGPGAPWNLVTVPILTGTPNLNGISAASASDAWAVGYHFVGSNQQTLVLHWNGSAWNVVTSPNPGAGNNVLTAVVAVNADNMWAVGNEQSGTSFSPITIHCNSALTCTSVTFPGIGTTAQLRAVTWRSSGSSVQLWASGFYADGSGAHALVGYGDGNSWGLINPNFPYVLNGIYAPVNTLAGLDAGSAVAGGDDETPGNPQIKASFVITRQVSLWNSVSPVTVGPGTNLFLGIGGFDGPGANVWGVGYSELSAGGTDQNMIQEFVADSGTPIPTSTPTSIPPSATPTSPPMTPTATETEQPPDCITRILLLAGFEYGYNMHAVIAEPHFFTTVGQRSNDHAAIIQCPGGTDREGATGPCVSEDCPVCTTEGSELDCVVSDGQGGEYACGEIEREGTVEPVILHQTQPGQQWTGENLAPYDHDRSVKAMAVVGTNVFAVGYRQSFPNGSVPIVLQLVNGVWTETTLPNQAPYTEVTSIEALGPNDIYVGGWQGSSLNSNDHLPYLVHWDGASWTGVSVPVPAPHTGGEIKALAARGSEVVLAGRYITDPPPPTGADTPMIEECAGSPIMCTPDLLPSGNSGVLSDMTETSVGDIWAVGEEETGSGSVPLELHLEATTWVEVQAPSVGNVSYLSAVTSLPSGRILAIGDYVDAGVDMPLVEEYACDWQPPAYCDISSINDVHPDDYFYESVEDLYCNEVISGYACGGDGEPCPGTYFRPYNNTTRSQMVKIITIALNIPTVTPSPGQYTFSDVLPDNVFFPYVETASASGIVGGYACGGDGEPCDDQNRPYFRPYNNVTRGQLSKIDVLASGWPLSNPTSGSFADIAPGSPFYQQIETSYCHGIINGYACGGPGEPCDGQNRPYFRAGNSAIRGQIAKIVHLTRTNPPVSCTP